MCKIHFLNTAPIYSVTAYVSKHFPSSVCIHPVLKEYVGFTYAKCQSAWEFYQFSAAIDAASHLEPTKEALCCFDKTPCSYCSFSDLLFNRQHGSDSNGISFLYWGCLRLTLYWVCIQSVCCVWACVPKSWCTYDNLQEVLETIWGFWFFCLWRWQKAWNVTCFWNSLPLNASLLWNVPVYPIKNPTEKGTKLNEAPLYTPWKQRLMLAHCLCACVQSYFLSIETALRSPSKLSSLLFGDCINQALVTLCLSW